LCVLLSFRPYYTVGLISLELQFILEKISFTITNLLRQLLNDKILADLIFILAKHIPCQGF